MYTSGSQRRRRRRPKPTRHHADHRESKQESSTSQQVVRTRTSRPRATPSSKVLVVQCLLGLVSIATTIHTVDGFGRRVSSGVAVFGTPAQQESSFVFASNVGVINIELGRRSTNNAIQRSWSSSSSSRGATDAPRCRIRLENTATTTSVEAISDETDGSSRKAGGTYIPSHIPKLSDLLKENTVSGIDEAGGRRGGERHDPAGTRRRESAVKLSRRRDQGGRTMAHERHALDDFVGEVETTDMRPASYSKSEGNVRHEDASSPDGESQPPPRPWGADLQTSRRTQSRIKRAAWSSKRNGLQRCVGCFDELLATPPSECNEVNVAGALTLGVKQLRDVPVSAMNAASCRDYDDIVEFRNKTVRLCSVIREILRSRDFTFRQLANIAYSLVKANQFVDRCHLGDDDPSEHGRGSDDMFGIVDETLVEIQRQLLQALSSPSSAPGGDRMTESPITNQPRAMEMSMISYAFASYYPRRCPPGWMWPPTDARVPLSSRKGRRSKGGTSIIFERQVFSAGEEENYGGGEREIETTSLNRGDDDGVYALFDAMGKFMLGNLDDGGDIEDESSIDGEAIKTSSGLLRECSWGELASIAWSYAQSGHTSFASEQLMKSLVDETLTRIGAAGTVDSSTSLSGSNSAGRQTPWTPLPWDISMIAWSLGVQQAENFHLGDDLERFIDAVSEMELANDDHLKAWKAKDLVQLAVALAHASIDNQGLLRALFRKACEHVNSFQSWELAVLLWVQARLHLTTKLDVAYGSFTREAVNCLVQRLMTTKEERRHTGGISLAEKIGLGPQEQANLAWSLTVLEEYTPESASLLDIMFRSSCREDAVMKLEHAHQLWQAYFLLQDECPDAVKDVPPDFSGWLEERWKEEKARKKVSSARHRALSDTLKLMRVAHYNEHDEDIDVAIVLQEDDNWTHKAAKGGPSSPGGATSRRLAVEFDGPAHFTRGGKRALGHTVLKYRLLKKQGWTVIRVPYYEFDKIPFWASMERQRYLQRLLKTHEGIKFSDVDVSEYKAIVPNRGSRYD